MGKDQRKTIVKVKKSGGDITDVMFDDNSVVSINEAIKMAENDEINNVNTGMTRGDNPHKTLRSNPDGDPSNNLDNLPTFE